MRPPAPPPSSSSLPSSRSAAGLTGCSMGGGSSQRTATAVFNDVGDLANGAQVQLADVPVGSVSNIALDGNQAKVTLTFDNDVRIPADVSAAIARTTILGDQFVQLNVPKSQTGAGAATAPQLADGAVITKTSTAADVEQFVAGGRERLRRHLDDRARADHRRPAGRASPARPRRSRPSSTNLDAVATTYSQHTAEITSAVNGLNSLSSTLAPASGTTATALDNLTKTVQILAQNSQQFETLLQSLDNLSTQGRSLLENYYPQIVTQLQTLQAVSSQLAQHQSDLAGPPLGDPGRQRQPAQCRAQRLRPALREHHRLRHPGPRARTTRSPRSRCAKTSGGSGS